MPPTRKRELRVVERLTANWSARASFVIGLALLFAPQLSVAATTPIGLLSDSSLSKLTHTTCTIAPAQRGRSNRYLMIEGPNCPVGGGDCRHIALMKIDGKVVELVRSDVASTTSANDTTSEFNLGTTTLRVHFEAPGKSGQNSKAGAKRVATLKLALNGRDVVVKGVASCGGD